MNNLKMGVLACGVLGLIACFIPEHGMSFFGTRQFAGSGQVFMVMGGFAVALVMGALAVAKPPMLRWQSIVATLGFAFVLFKFRSIIMESLKHGGISGRLMMIAALVGVVVSVLTLVKPETAR